MDALYDPVTWIPVGVLAVLWTAEAVVPFYSQFRKRLGERLRHDLRNLALGLLNKLLVIAAFSSLYGLVLTWADTQSFGLLRQVELPKWGGVLAAFLLLDLWTYCWHRLNHIVPFLWRFHRVHHSDPTMDTSTGVRFHTGEVVLSAVLRLGVITLLGATAWQVVLYDAVFLPIVLFHHSNLRLPRWLDYGLLCLVVTPAMHRVHHSRWRPQTNSNYGSVLPWWDMLFRTFIVRRDAHAVRLGLHGYDEPADQTFWGMLTTPVTQPRRRQGGANDEREEAEPNAGKSTPSSDQDDKQETYR